jgi:shikimate kinase
MNIILIGFRCTGKTTIGKLLAKKLKYNFFSIDEEIIRRNKKTITQLVQEKGWRYFRNCESEVIKNLSNLDKYIIDTGGGAIISRKNRMVLKKNGFIILFTSNQKIIMERMLNGTDRPELKTGLKLKEEIRLLLKERKKKYLFIANMKINTSINPIDTCVNKIISATESLRKKV